MTNILPDLYRWFSRIYGFTSHLLDRDFEISKLNKLIINETLEKSLTPQTIIMRYEMSELL